MEQMRCSYVDNTKRWVEPKSWGGSRQSMARGNRRIYARVRLCYHRIMKASWSGAEIVTRNGEPVSVILPIDQYEQLLKQA